MSNEFYGRKWNLSVLTKSGRVITFDPDFQIVFDFDKNISQTFQVGEFTIYNLSADTETDILANGYRMTFEAGYAEGAYGKAFSGSIIQAIRGKEDSVSYYLKLVVVDGDSALNLGLANLTVASETTVREMVRQVARSSSVSFDVQVDESIGTQKIGKGASFFGKPSKTLRSIAIQHNAAFFFDNDVAYLSALNQSPNGNIPDFNYKSGLIGFPIQTDSGIQAKILINSNLKLGGWFRLNNKDIIVNQLEFGVPQTPLDADGLYRVIRYHASGDTRGNPWYYDITAVSQVGSLNLLIADPTQNWT
jgi:hypothetical protein